MRECVTACLHVGTKGIRYTQDCSDSVYMHQQTISFLAVTSATVATLAFVISPMSAFRNVQLPQQHADAVALRRKDASALEACSWLRRLRALLHRSQKCHMPCMFCMRVRLRAATSALSELDPHIKASMAVEAQPCVNEVSTYPLKPSRSCCPHC